MAIGQYTDTDIVIDIEGGVLSDLHGMHVTFAQGTTVVDVTDVSVTSPTRLIVPLSQVQTGRFNDANPVKVQLNYFTAANKRKKSDIVEIEVGSNLLRRIVNDPGH